MAATGYSGAGLGGYGVGSVNTGKTVSDDDDVEYTKLKRYYCDYLDLKRQEIDEQQDARRQRHGSQWTEEQEKQLKARKQPIVTINRISRKIHGVIGVLSRLKQDPKAYPRTPEHEAGAELASACIRFVMDSNQWDATDYYCGEMCAVDGIAGVGMNVVQGDKGDPDIEIVAFNTDSFFYDPRSYKLDFSDARWMGVGKWLDLDEAQDLFPEFKEDLADALETGSDLTTDPDREHRWFSTDSHRKRVRVVEHWYVKKGEWHWCIYYGGGKLKSGKSPFRDEKNKTICKYMAWSAYVDQDGDRYGFIRDLKPLQQELNMRRSKALYTMLGRRILAPKGAFPNVEIARREAARVDGVVVYNTGVEKPEFDDQARMAESNAQFQFYEATKMDLESFGPNVAISTGEGLEKASGRAIHLLQQAGLADLGPFLQSYRAWKINVYRAVWNAIRSLWKQERWIRVTDDEQVKQFIQVNGFQRDEWGIPRAVNEIGALDVDIIIDEGPDTVNAMADAFDTLEVLAQRGAEIPPDVLIELAPLPFTLKKKLLEKMQPKPSPQEERGMELELAEKESVVHENIASAEYKKAQAYKALAEANAPEEAQAPVEQTDPRVTEAEILEKQASAQAKYAQAEATRAKINLDATKAQSDIRNSSQQTAAQVANLNSQREKTDMDTALRPHELQNERSKQGMDFELKREQIRNKPKGGSE